MFKYFSHSIRLGFIGLSCLTVGLFLGSCQRPSVSSTSSIIEAEILTRLPASSIGFFAWDQTHPAYAKFRQSPWGDSGTLTLFKNADKFGQLEPTKDLESFLRIIEKSGLITTSAQQPESLAQGVIFFDAATGAPRPEFAAYVLAKTGTNLREKLSALTELFKTEGYTTSVMTLPDADGFSVQLKPDAAGVAKIEKIYCGANQKFLGLATSEALVRQLFAPAPQSGLAALKTVPAFIQVTNKLPPDGSAFSFAYADFGRLIKGVDTALAGLPSEQKTALTEATPIQAIGLVRSFSETLHDQVVVSLAAKTPDQKNWLSALAGAKPISSQALINSQPGAILASLALQGNVLRQMKDLAINEMSAESQTELKAKLAPIDTCSSMTLGLRQPSGASPLPEVFLLAECNSAQILTAALKEAVSSTMTSFGLPVSPWQTKQVGSTNVEYSLSPLGAGVYLGSVDNLTVVASTENLIADLLEIRAGKLPGLKAELDASAKASLEKDSSSLVVNVDFHRIAGLLQNIEGSLAMFTGGQTSLGSDNTAMLKRIGGLLSLVQFTTSAITVHNIYRAPPKS